MFTDYYATLGINENATQEEIKAAFRKQAVRWHPDMNPGQDTTVRMQQINEAYLILKDAEARTLYDREYARFKQHREQKAYSQRETSAKTGADQRGRKEHAPEQERQYEYADYHVYDELLKKWMNNARLQAVDLAIRTIRDFKDISKAGAGAFAKEATAGFFRYILFSIFILVIVAIARSCGN